MSNKSRDLKIYIFSEKQISLNGALSNGGGGGSHSHHQPETAQIRDRKEISHLVKQ